MTPSNFLKLNVLILLISVHETAEGATNYLSDNTINTNKTPQPSLDSRIPQVYFVPYSKYISSSKHKYVVSQPETQIPVALTSTEKALLSSNYKMVDLEDSKDATSQVVKPPQVNPVNYPYIYSLTKGASSTATTYSSDSTAGNDNYEEVPKKYHYGYRVSNPHSGTEFGHSEVNDGISARGYYHVLLPDGRLQNVKYWAGPSGYHATITYESQY